MSRASPAFVAATALVLFAACTDYGLRGKPDDQGGRGDDTAPTGDGGGDLGDGGSDGGGDPPDDETGVPDFTDCEDVGLWSGQWYGSMPFSSEGALTDSSGRAYTATDYEMRDYSTVSMPDEGHIPSGSDKAYRGELWLDATGPRIFLDIQSDDGVWIHVNGVEVGHWGGDWQEEGCVNDLANCTEFVVAAPVEISDRLVPGNNLLAVRVSNAVNNSYMWVSPRCSDE